MKKLILHIGTHKTGTTAIQNCLNDNRALLLEHGVCYPEKGVDYFAHQNIAYELMDDKRYVPENGALSEAIEEFNASSASLCILSSENFEFLSIETLRDLAAFFSEHSFQCSVVGYYRNQSDFLLSEYTQRVKHGFYLKDFKAFLLEECKKERYVYQNYFDKWLKVFGEQCDFRLFDKNYLYKGNVISDFFYHSIRVDALVNADLSTSKSSSNIRPPDAVVESIRVIANYYVGEKKMDPYEFSKKFSSPILSLKKLNSEIRSDFYYLDQAIKSLIDSVYEPINADFQSNESSSLLGSELKQIEEKISFFLKDFNRSDSDIVSVNSLSNVLVALTQAS